MPILDANGQPFVKPEPAAVTERHEALRRAIRLREAGGRVQLAGAWYLIGEVLTTGPCLIYQEPTGKWKKKRKGKP